MCGAPLDVPNPAFRGYLRGKPAATVAVAEAGVVVVISVAVTVVVMSVVVAVAAVVEVGRWWRGRRAAPYQDSRR